jgi:hypothetical protein
MNMEMKFPHRKSTSQRLVESVSELLELPGAHKPTRRSRIRSAVPSAIKTSGPNQPLKARLSQGNARTTSFIAGAFASLTAGSAGISALRRHKEGAGDRS